MSAARARRQGRMVSLSPRESHAPECKPRPGELSGLVPLFDPYVDWDAVRNVRP